MANRIDTCACCKQIILHKDVTIKSRLFMLCIRCFCHEAKQQRQEIGPTILALHDLNATTVRLALRVADACRQNREASPQAELAAFAPLEDDEAHLLVDCRAGNLNAAQDFACRIDDRTPEYRFCHLTKQDGTAGAVFPIPDEMLPHTFPDKPTFLRVCQDTTREEYCSDPRNTIPPRCHIFSDQRQYLLQRILLEIIDRRPEDPDIAAHLFNLCNSTFLTWKGLINRLPLSEERKHFYANLNDQQVSAISRLWPIPLDNPIPLFEWYLSQEPDTQLKICCLPRNLLEIACREFWQLGQMTKNDLSFLLDHAPSLLAVSCPSTLLRTVNGLICFLQECKRQNKELHRFLIQRRLPENLAQTILSLPPEIRSFFDIRKILESLDEADLPAIFSSAEKDEIASKELVAKFQKLGLDRINLRCLIHSLRILPNEKIILEKTLGLPPLNWEIELINWANTQRLPFKAILTLFKPNIQNHIRCFRECARPLESLHWFSNLSDEDQQLVLSRSPEILANVIKYQLHTPKLNEDFTRVFIDVPFLLKHLPEAIFYNEGLLRTICIFDALIPIMQFALNNHSRHFKWLSQDIQIFSGFIQLSLGGRSLGYPMLKEILRLAIQNQEFITPSVTQSKLTNQLLFALLPQRGEETEAYDNRYFLLTAILSLQLPDTEKHWAKRVFDARNPVGVDTPFGKFLLRLQSENIIPPLTILTHQNKIWILETPIRSTAGENLNIPFWKESDPSQMEYLLSLAKDRFIPIVKDPSLINHPLMNVAAEFGQGFLAGFIFTHITNSDARIKVAVAFFSALLLYNEITGIHQIRERASAGHRRRLGFALAASLNTSGALVTILALTAIHYLNHMSNRANTIHQK